MKKFLFILMSLFLSCTMLSACDRTELDPVKNFEYEGPNLTDILFDYYAYHYTDTYQTIDQSLEIRADFEFYSTWGVLSYILPLEHAISKTVINYESAYVLDHPEETAVEAQQLFIGMYGPWKLKIRKLTFSEIVPIK